MPGPQRLAMSVLLCALVMAGGTSACTTTAEKRGRGDETAAESSKAAERTEPSHGVAVPRLPLDSYKPTPADELTMDRAVGLLASRCMEKKGLSWPAKSAPLGTPRSPNERRYGAIDPAAARQYGYQVPPAHGVTRAQEAQQAARELKRREEISDALMAAYVGVDGREADHGCRGEARARLGLAFLDGVVTDPVGQAEAQAWRATSTDASANAVDREWSSCMKRAGYKYSDPHAAAAAWKLSENRDPAKPIEAPSQREVSAALADVNCKLEVRYVARWQQIEATHQRGAMRPLQDEIDGARERWVAALKKCRQQYIIADSLVQGIPT